MERDSAERETKLKAVERAWSRIGRSEWDQVTWFVRLANADISAFSEGERRNLQEEFVAVAIEYSQRYYSVEREATKARRYWKPTNYEPTISELPSDDEMRAVQAEAIRLLTGLARGESWVMSRAITEITSVSFRKLSPEEAAVAGVRYSIARGSVLPDGLRPFSCLELWLVRLLERWSDNIRECILCGRVFLQNKRSGRYCGKECRDTGSMWTFRGKPLPGARRIGLPEHLAGSSVLAAEPSSKSINGKKKAERKAPKAAGTRTAKEHE